MTTPKMKAGEKPYAQAAELYDSMLENAIRMNRVIASGIERTLQEQVDLMEAAVEAMRPFSAVKQPADFVTTQVDVMKGLNQRAVAAATNLLKIQQETGSELKDAMLEGMKKVTGSMPKAA